MALDLERCWVYRDYIAATGALNLMARFITNPGVPKSDIGWALSHLINASVDLCICQGPNSTILLASLAPLAKYPPLCTLT